MNVAGLIFGLFFVGLGVVVFRLRFRLSEFNRGFWRYRSDSYAKVDRAITTIVALVFGGAGVLLLVLGLGLIE